MAQLACKLALLCGCTGLLTATDSAPSIPCSPSCHAPALPSPSSPQGLETYKGSWDCAVQILRNHGIKGLYRGMTSTVLRDIQVRSAVRALEGCSGARCSGLRRSPAGGTCLCTGPQPVPLPPTHPSCPQPLPSHPTHPAQPPLPLPRSQGYAWFFLCYEATLHALAGPAHQRQELDYKHVLGAGVMAGFGLWGSMFPIDTIKSKMQVAGWGCGGYSGGVLGGWGSVWRRNHSWLGHAGLGQHGSVDDGAA